MRSPTSNSEPNSEHSHDSPKNMFYIHAGYGKTVIFKQKLKIRVASKN